MRCFESLETFQKRLRENSADEHKNVMRRRFYEEIGRRWLVLALQFNKSKIRICPSQVAYGIRRDTLLWPLGKIVVQKRAGDRFRIVSNLSTDILFDESSLTEYLSILLSEDDQTDLLHLLEELEGTKRSGKDWCDRHIDLIDDSGRERKISKYFREATGMWLGDNFEKFPNCDFLSTNFVITTKISRHSVKGCFESFPSIIGAIRDIPFDIENPYDWAGDELEWTNSIRDIPDFLGHVFLPPASEEIELIL